MPITNLLFWLVLSGAAWIVYQLVFSYNQAEAEARREIAVCRGRIRQQRVGQFDSRIGSQTVRETEVFHHEYSFMTVGENLTTNLASEIDFQLPSAVVVNHNEMAADTDCQSCA